MLIEIIINFHWIRSSWVRHSYFKSLYYSWLLVCLPRDQQVFLKLLTPHPCHTCFTFYSTHLFFSLSRTPVLILCYEYPLIFTNLAPLAHLFHVYFMHSHIYFTHPACLLCAPPISYNSHPLYLCFLFLGLCLCITRGTPHITHAPIIVVFFFFFFTFIFLLSFFFLFFS